MVASYHSFEGVSVKLNSQDEFISELKNSISSVQNNIHSLANQYVSVEMIIKNVQKDLENLFASSLLMSDKIDLFKNNLVEKVSKLEKTQEGWQQKYKFYLSSLPKFFGYIFAVSFGAILLLSIIDSHYSLDNFIKLFNKIF